MPSNNGDTDSTRPVSSDLGWVLAFIGVTAFAVAGLMGLVRL